MSGYEGETDLRACRRSQPACSWVRRCRTSGSPHSHQCVWSPSSGRYLFATLTSQGSVSRDHQRLQQVLHGLTVMGGEKGSVGVRFKEEHINNEQQEAFSTRK